MLIISAIHQNKITIINLYAPNVSAPNFVKHAQKELKHIWIPTQWYWENLIPLYKKQISHANKK
jgi:hypothetical protein